MSNANPYELRFQIFETARNTLVDEYWAQVNRREVLIETGGVDTIPDFPTYPSMSEVMERVQVINDFVSKAFHFLVWNKTQVGECIAHIFALYALYAIVFPT